MSFPAEPGATGRKVRGGAAAQTPAALEAPVPPIEGDTSAAAIAAGTAGTAGEVAQAAEKPVVVGDTETPVKPGGPGVGAERVAEPVEAVASRPMAGSEASIAALTAAERAELEDLRRERTDNLRRSEDLARAEVEHAETNRRVAARHGLVVDAAAIREIRLAQAAASILRDGRPYAVGQPVPVDFEAYTELVGIGAIVNDRWADLPVVGEA